MRWWETRWIDRRKDGRYMVREVGGGWATNQGPYKYWIIAFLVWLFVQ